jgi:hypothetical protein
MYSVLNCHNVAKHTEFHLGYANVSSKQDDERFLDSVFFSDASTFHVSGKVINTHNCRIWGSEKPHVSLEHAQRWTCFVPSSKGVRPLVLHGDDHYRYRVSGHTPTVPQSTVRRRWPRTHTLPARRRTLQSWEVREYLNTHFPGRWIGKAEPVAWPPRSPDLTPLDFFLWGFV